MVKTNHKHQLNLKQNKMYIQSFPIIDPNIFVNAIGAQNFAAVHVSTIQGYQVVNDNGQFWLDKKGQTQEPLPPVQLIYFVANTDIIEVSQSINFRPNERPRID